MTASRAISAVDELLVVKPRRIIDYWYGKNIFNFGIDSIQNAWSYGIQLLLYYVACGYL